MPRMSVESGKKSGGKEAEDEVFFEREIHSDATTSTPANVSGKTRKRKRLTQTSPRKTRLRSKMSQSESTLSDGGARMSRNSPLLR